MTVPKDIKQISEAIWEIPASYKKGMNVPARIYATKKLLEEMDQGVFEQVTNVACLPGIEMYSMCMPDGHWGYGFPIGGVAAFDTKEGVISPGGIGFDINCIHPETRILTRYGYFRKIKELDISNDHISFLELKDNKKKYSKAILYLKKKDNNKTLKIRTKYGEELILSEDHPIYTGKSFIDAGKIYIGSKIVVHPYFGIEYETPSEKIILGEEDIVKIIGNRKKILKELKEKDLLPLKFSSKNLPILARLVGFLTGDGWLGSYYSKKRGMNIWSMKVIGKIGDLEELKSDINLLGYDCNHISNKKYISKIEQIDGTSRTIDGYSTQMHIGSQSLSVLLFALGVPSGNKSRSTVNVPRWIKKSPLWIKRLYLAGLFGAELTKPTQRKGEEFTFIEPNFSQNKINRLERENLNFIMEIINLLLDFNVTVNKIYKQKGVINSYGEETHKLALRISTKASNLINLWGKIGYEYCKERKELSALSLAYLKYKQNVLKKTKKIVNKSKEQFSQGLSHREICLNINEKWISHGMIKAQIYNNSKNVKINKGFPTFKEFLEGNKINNSEFVLDEIEEIEEIDYDGCLYDITMKDVNHNFIANSIVSHNCGMRLVTTNLTFKEVKPQITKIVDTLFKTVPSGVGSKGFVKSNKQQFIEIMNSGVKWCVDNGYGWEDDLKKCEGHGKIDWADHTTVSEKAISRGINQLGTLGSGNHYLEIQLVKASNIYDEKTAKVFGIHTPDQIVVMVHCGSRGFGHQVASDYLKVFDEAMKKYNIKVNDRELSCAPFSSEEGQRYYKAMACAANMAFANRQVILHRIREGFEKVFNKKAEYLEMNLVYDVAHNIAKVEKHKINGKTKEVVVHRKGSTRAFPPGHPELPSCYQKTGQPVIIGGSMETGSFLLAGTEKAMEETFGSTAHGSGRTMSRTQAKKQVRGDKLQKEMQERGIYVKSSSMSGLAEEAGLAYKEINSIVESLEKAGISKKVVKLLPIGNLKG